MKKNLFTKMLTLLIILALVVPCLPVIASADDYTYETRTVTEEQKAAWLATESNKVLMINSVTDLACFMACGAQTGSEANTSRFNGKTIKLGADIVWNDGSIIDGAFVPTSGTTIYTWTPYWSGDATNTSVYYGFRGTFDGDGHTISGIYIKGAGDLGFFQRTGNGAVIKNVTFRNLFLSSSGQYAGALVSTVGGNALTVSNVNMLNCYVKGTQYVSSIASRMLPAGNPAVTLTFSNVNSDCKLVGTNFVGGLLAYSGTTTANTVNISNCTLTGSISASGNGVGGFVSISRRDKITVSNSVCYAEISAAKYVGGFIGVGAAFSENTLSFNNCAFLGSIQDSGAGNADYQGAFACLRRDVSFNVGTAMTAGDGTGNVELTDCYFAHGSATCALAIDETTPWFRVSVSYTGEVDPRTYDCTTAEDDTAAKKDAAMTALFRALPVKTTDVVTVEGVQTKTETGTFDARFVASVKFDENLKESTITEIGFEVSRLGTYASTNGTVEQAKTCSEVYMSVTSNYGLETVTANAYSADYIATLVIENIPDSATQTLLIRPYCRTASETFYGSFIAVTFIGGNVAASAMVD